MSNKIYIFYASTVHSTHDKSSTATLPYLQSCKSKLSHIKINCYTQVNSLSLWNVFCSRYYFCNAKPIWYLYEERDLAVEHILWSVIRNEIKFIWQISVNRNWKTLISHINRFFTQETTNKKKNENWIVCFQLRATKRS